MSFLLRILPHRLPTIVREQILEALFDAAADAFGCPTPAPKHLSYNEHLMDFALFTREQAKKALQSGCDIPSIKTKLYQNAYPLGRTLRQWFCIDTMDEVMELGQILYDAIGVEIQGDPQGNLNVSRCYFSQVYSGPICGLISALDDGLFSGLSGDGRLRFSERLTEGSHRCRAKISV